MPNLLVAILLRASRCSLALLLLQGEFGAHHTIQISKKAKESPTKGTRKSSKKKSACTVVGSAAEAALNDEESSQSGSSDGESDVEDAPEADVGEVDPTEDANDTLLVLEAW